VCDVFSSWFFPKPTEIENQYHTLKTQRNTTEVLSGVVGRASRHIEITSSIL